MDYKIVCSMIDALTVNDYLPADTLAASNIGSKNIIEEKILRRSFLLSEIPDAILVNLSSLTRSITNNIVRL